MLFTQALVLALALLGPAAEPRVTVFAAISLTDALDEIGKAYKASGGSDIRFNFAASNVLARQVANGAPADLFISADEVQMNYVERARAIDPSTRVSFLSNRLAIIVPRSSPLSMTGPAGLLDDRIRRVAIGDPAAVPAGTYAKTYLQRAGLWDALRTRLLPLASVRAALAAVESGGADAGIVYESDTVMSRRVRLAYVVPQSEGPRIVYPAAITKNARHREEAHRFLAFLQGAEAREIFLRFKFSPHVRTH